VPITHVTNGVHTPTWDSRAADQLWERLCGKARWLGDLVDAARAFAGVGDDELWSSRAEMRRELVAQVRRRLGRQIASRGAEPDAVARAAHVLDEHALTLGFARRFTAYKRPTLLLTDRARLTRLLTDHDRPVQLLIAGKAHPADEIGKQAVRAWIEFAQDLAVRDHVVFLEDYDLTLAQELVRGVDVWINTPRRPWEACGTSGMKVLVNGGLNISTLDGWWAEGYSPARGWAVGDGATHDDPAWDAVEADQLYRALEDDVVPEFYDRGVDGLPVRWLARIRASTSELAPRFSANRMVREYVDTLYARGSDRFRERSSDAGRIARELVRWADVIDRGWSQVSFGPLDVARVGNGWVFSIPIDLGVLDASMVRVELYADPTPDHPNAHVPMTAAEREGRAVYTAAVTTTRPASDFTPRVMPFHPHACVPAEASQIRWAR
jgi:starch phosphorylase